MELAKKVAFAINNTFWTSSAFPYTVFGIRLYNSQPYSNFDYPFQLQINFFNPGPDYLADTQQQLGGVSLDGIIAYSGGAWEGVLSADGKKISWKGTIGMKPVVWEKVENVPANTENNQYSSQAISDIARQQSTYLNDRVRTAYPYQS